MSNKSYTIIAPLLNTDAYKLDHRRQYELSGKITRVYSNYTHRGSRIFGVDKIVHFGLQAALKKCLNKAWQGFFNADEDRVCALYDERVTSILGRPIPVDHIRALHRLGFLPLRVCSAPEGTRIPIGVPSWTIENTAPEFFWLTNYVETVLSCATWLGSTSATIAAEYRRILLEAADLTGTDPATVDWAAHDFSSRGMSSPESAALSGAAHLLSFYGSDTLCALEFVDQYYGGGAILGSVAATEHSVMCAGIAMAGERAMFERLLDLYPTGILSIVSDTFNLWDVCTKILPALRDKINARVGKLVIRPDSGDPLKILCGNPAAKPNSPEHLGVIRLLDQTFGHTVNEKGYKHLNSRVGAIYGDSITLNRAKDITHKLRTLGYASDVVVFGVGSYTYQYQTRDTFMSAIKATEVVVDGASVSIKKDPVTDGGTKKSATGRLAVLADEKTGELRLVQNASPVEESASLLQPLWENGYFIRRENFCDIQRRVRNG